MPNSKVKTISVIAHPRPNNIDPFVSVSFHRDNRVSSSTFHPTPSTLRRVMQWQAATFLAGRNLNEVTA